MRSLPYLAVAVCLALLPAGASAQEKAKAPTFCCPVVGFPAAMDKCCCPGGYCPRRPSDRVTVEHAGHALQFCCRQCVAIFKKAPEKFLANANHQLAARGLATQTRCPLCGGAPRGVAIDVAGVPVRLCGEGCKQKAAQLTLRQQIDLVFGKKPFAAAFAVKPAKK